VQSLPLSNIRLGSVRKAISDAGLQQAVDQLDAVREMVSEGIRQYRLIMGDLKPSLLYELELGPAPMQLAEQLQSPQGTQIQVQITTGKAKAVADSRVTS
jgi:signal transduction histidine kinase